MIKALRAYTSNLEDTDAAVAEILEQLNLEKELLENSIGILTCYSDYVEAGIAKALCDALPFDVMGSTTIDGAVLGGAPATLSLLVLTSSDVFFSAALSRPLDKNSFEPAIRDVYLDALKNLGRQCVVGLTVFPFLRWAGGDEVLRILDSVSGNVPLFGLVSTSYTTNIGPPVLFKAKTRELICCADRAAILLLAGNVRARFATASIMKEKISKNRAQVTDSERNVVKALDGIPAVSYLEKFGLAEKGQIRWELTIPLVVDRRDGAGTVSLVILDQTPEGYLRVGGSVPRGSLVRIGSIDHGDVLKTITSVTDIAGRETGAFFFFSCAVRGFALNINGTAEIDKVEEILGRSVPYLFAYAGGEICPLSTQDGRLVNRFHNMTAIGCALE
jgi:hypothetical protein